MFAALKPLKAKSLKDQCTDRFERLILSGELVIGQRLPPERELALQLGVSRPVIHESLVDLAAKGLIVLKPRVGAVVSDYRKEGSLAMLSSLVNYHNGRLDPRLLDSVLEMRILFENETARLAALNRTSDHLAKFEKLLIREGDVDPRDTEAVTELDFRFHHLVAMATDNVIYPLLLNSFKQFYTSLSARFFSDPGMAAAVFPVHRDMVDAIRKRDEHQSVALMKRLLNHGERHLRSMITDRGQQE